jgi:hypothetical protein
MARQHVADLHPGRVRLLDDPPGGALGGQGPRWGSLELLCDRDAQPICRKSAAG